MARTLYILHHSHTDIGYTELQSRVERWHVDYIRQALRIVADDPRFKWNCETFWPVERFLGRATEHERRSFTDAVRAGNIGLSANYLNLNELADAELLDYVTRRAAAFGESIGVPVDSAMTADINGYSWGFAQALHDHGVRNLFTCIHTHHGTFPLGRQQIPFWWETPRGDRLLVWSGEHYHFGNELGLVPGAVSSYLTKDECDAEMIFSDCWNVARIRIPRYFERLEREGYPYDFVPVMASGLRSDNAPPSRGVLEMLTRWNREHGERYPVALSTLSEFFGLLREQSGKIPTHRGDWPDWWSDGAAASPAATRLFRQAQRDRSLYRRLLARYPQLGGDAGLDRVELELALYAEHTFSHCVSMSRPWDPAVHAISATKKSHAARAHDGIRGLLDDALQALGATAPSDRMSLRYRIVNPWEHEIESVARLRVHDFEIHERKLGPGAEVLDAATGSVLESQMDLVPLGADYCVPLSVGAGEERRLALRPAPIRERLEPAAVLETPHVRVVWEVGEGLTGWLDRHREVGLLRADRKHGPLTPLHELTPVADRDQICRVRGKMDLNRKGPNVVRRAGELVDVERIEPGAVFSSVTLTYQVPGTSFYELELRAYRHTPRIDAAVRLHKLSQWEPENLYVALPFTTGCPEEQLWLDKAGAAVRPRVDQLPGTLTDFYSLQAGFALVADGFGVAVATPDTHLLQLGRLEHGPRPLAGAAELEAERPLPYAWPMTNYWETNFDASLGGFHEFRFLVTWGDDLGSAERALEVCRDLNRELPCFRLSD